MDILLQGGERLRLAGNDWLTVYHVPGHTPGHLCLYNPTYRYALVRDAIFGLSQLDTAGDRSAPPPYTDVDAYRGTLQTLAALEIDLLLTCHYPVMRGEGVRRFIDDSRCFVDLTEEVTRRLLREASGPVKLVDAIDRANRLLGPFGFPRDFQYAMVGHLEAAVARREAVHVAHDGVTAWAWIAGAGAQ